jgi:O-antigen ligase
MLVLVGLASGALGLLQAIGGGQPQFYEIAHRGYPTGLFANKNHQSILLLWLMLAGSWLVTMTDSRRHSTKAILGGALALILVLFPLLILTGSRAGLLLSPLALLLSGWLLFAAPATKNILRRAGRRAKIMASAAVVVIVAQLLFVLGVLATSDRQTALSRLFERESVEELRWAYTQVFVDMSEAYLPFGSGLGSFESVFNGFEPAGMLTSRYMNQAHNDLIQLAIEGGFPAMAILLMALLWLAYSCWKLWHSSQREMQITAVFYGGSVLLWLAASVVDYPLRTPLAAMLVATLTTQLAMLSTGTRSRSGLPTKQAPPAQEF